MVKQKVLQIVRKDELIRIVLNDIELNDKLI